MLRFSSVFIAIASLAIAFLAVPMTGQTAGLPKCVSIDLIAEYKSHTKGVEKILFRNMTIKPGASLTLTVPAQSLCQGTKGVLEVTNLTTGKVTIHKAVDRWATTPGQKVTLANRGSVDHEHLLYPMIGKM